MRVFSSARNRAAFPSFSMDARLYLARSISRRSFSVWSLRVESSRIPMSAISLSASAMCWNAAWTFRRLATEHHLEGLIQLAEVRRGLRGVRSLRLSEARRRTLNGLERALHGHGGGGLGLAHGGLVPPPRGGSRPAPLLTRLRLDHRPTQRASVLAARHYSYPPAPIPAPRSHRSNRLMRFPMLPWLTSLSRRA